MFWFVVALLVVALGAGAWFWWHNRGPRDKVYFTCRCPKCDRKIRYPASQVGHYAICPGCKHRVPLPDEDEEEEGGHRDHRPAEYRLRRRMGNARGS